MASKSRGRGAGGRGGKKSGCGTGAGGFASGNKCQKKGGGKSGASGGKPAKRATRVEPREAAGAKEVKRFKTRDGRDARKLRSQDGTIYHAVKGEDGRETFYRIGSANGGGGKANPAADADAERRAKFTGAKVGKDVHVYSADREQEVAQAVGGEVIGGYTKTNADKAAGVKGNGYPPADVRAKVPGGEAVIEVKSMTVGGKQSISVHADALARKIDFEGASPGRKFHTVVVDGRADFGGGSNAENYSGNRLYYKRGGGRYSLSKMHPVKDGAELKRLIRAKDSELPEAARGSLPPPPPPAEIKARAEKAHASRLNKDRARKARLRAARA